MEIPAQVPVSVTTAEHVVFAVQDPLSYPSTDLSF